MTVYRLILPDWQKSSNKKVIEGQFSFEELQRYNAEGYNIYYLPNHPSLYEGGTVYGYQIDQFNYCFVDFDLKSGNYASKEEFIEKLMQFPLLPNLIVDSGNGIHAYWRISDLDAMTYLKLQRRLISQFNTDVAVGQIFQLMRVPNTYNTKIEGQFKLAEVLHQDDGQYTAAMLDEVLPILTPEDDAYCQQHYNRTYKKEDPIKVNEEIPLKFAKLLRANNEVNAIWSGQSEDRSAGDFRLGHLMLAANFTKDEAMSVLINTPKAMERAPAHRVSYAKNIVDKIWAFELEEAASELNLSSSVQDILNKSGNALKGTRFPCWSYLDNTVHGFRLGQVIGLVAGSGVGKTSVALNMFLGFVQNNPDYDHFFIPLEQPAEEIADRWRTLCGDNTHLYSKVQVLSNYDADGHFRHLSFQEIKEYIIKYQTLTKRKVGCVVIDHIGALKKKGKDGENQDLMTICHEMKAFAVQTNTMLVMQSQAPREKAGIGDLELNKDAAYGTMYFEAYCDYLITIHQPLKRCYKDGAPTITSFKFCKIRHKKQDQDAIKEDVCYKLMFDSETELLRELTQNEEASFDFFLKQATNKRKQDRKTDLVEYVSVKTN